MAGDNTDRDEFDEAIIERPQGILTSTERDVLLSDEQFESRGREARARIRRRLDDALLDYVILDENLPYRDFAQVYGDPDDAVAQMLAPALRAQVRFIFQAAEAAGFDAEELIDDAVEQAKRDRGDLYEKYQTDPESLTVRELSALREFGEITPEEFDDVVSGARRRPPVGNVDPDEASEYDSLARFLEDKVAERRRDM